MVFCDFVLLFFVWYFIICFGAYFNLLHFEPPPLPLRMATPADDHSEKVLVYHEWLNVSSPELFSLVRPSNTGL